MDCASLQPVRAPSIPSSKLSEAGLSKALRLFALVADVNEKTPLMHPDDAIKVIAAIDETMRPCTRMEAATLVAELIGAYPDLSMAKNDPAQSKDFALYSLKLHEAFTQFSFNVGKAIVHGGTGLPSQNPYRPKPADVVAFGKAEVEKLQNAKTMAQRHLAEKARREQARKAEEEFQRHRPSLERRKAQVSALLETLSRPGDPSDRNSRGCPCHV